MAEQAQITTTPDALALTGVLGFVSVVELEPLGVKWLREQAAAVCTIDLAAVSYSSSAGLVLLLAWLRIATQLGKTLHIKNMPADMAALASVGGLVELLPRS
ncbi:MAG TPA: STAS domain-containing protein [Spongiibacteraceae bacterium]|nr:STAS domain-containing protein [Spongiibacteraceae bacterium]